MSVKRIFYTVDSLRNHFASLGENIQIGLIPTMGALHHGHMGLVRSSLAQCDVTVVSIFVNPKQFNNPEDLENYPRTLDRDVELLQEQGDVVVFAPSVDEVYPKNYTPAQLELGDLGTKMEGEFRPGHFDGVVKVVNRFFEIVQPTYAYFGAKDYQQLAIIQFMVKSFNLDVTVVPCETIREESGLASSSRNYRLNQSQLDDAAVIYRALTFAREHAGEKSIEEIKTDIRTIFNESPLELEYFEVIHPETLQIINHWMPGAHACTAAFCGGVRLIDNMRLLEG